jgi:hypothetical protein
MRKAESWADDFFLGKKWDRVEFVRAIQADALASACNAIARIDRATLSLAAGEFELRGWRDAKAALAVAEQAVRRLTPGTTDSSSSSGERG